jgi:hypothetical protein
MVLMAWVVAGPEALRAVVRGVQHGGSRIGLGGIDGPAIFAALVTVSAAMGAAVGALAWALAGRVLRRLGRGP